MATRVTFGLPRARAQPTEVRSAGRRSRRADRRRRRLRACACRVFGIVPSSARRARNAVFVAFVGSGFGFASWASRIPQIRDALQASPSELGLILLGRRGGALIAMPLAGLVVTASGRPGRSPSWPPCCRWAWSWSRRLRRSGSLPVVVGLFLIGYGNGTWDVAMNVEGAAVEQRLGRAIMPRFHAGFSVGTVVGALGRRGDAWPSTSRSPPTCWPWPCVNVAVVPVSALRGFLPERRPAGAGDPRREAAQPADRVAGAADAADRRVRALHGLHRGHRQRLAGSGGDRRLRRPRRWSVR